MSSVEIGGIALFFHSIFLSQFFYINSISQENEMEEESPDNIAASREESDTFHGGPLSREDYVHSEAQPGTSELCERLQR